MLQIPKPFTDELAHAHRIRILALNNMSAGKNIHQPVYFNQFIQATQPLKPKNWPLKWKVKFTHEITALLVGMDSYTYRARHTMLALTANWKYMRDQSLVCNRDLWQYYAFPGLYYNKALKVPPERLCRKCVEEDMHHHAMGWWKRKHHICGIDICPTHLTPLEHCPPGTILNDVNPSKAQGKESDAALVEANFHSIIMRYCNLVQMVLLEASTIHYPAVLEQTIARLKEMKKQREFQVPTERASEVDILWKHVCAKLPSHWVTYHGAYDCTNARRYLKERPSDELFQEMTFFRLYSLQNPIYLLMVMSTIFDGDREIENILSKQSEMEL